MVKAQLDMPRLVQGDFPAIIQNMIKNLSVPSTRFILNIAGRSAFIEATEIHYGKRSNILYIEPRLKNLLTEYGFSFADDISKADATWGRNSVVFPRIQGADAVGRIVAVGHGVSRKRVGERVIVDPWIRDRSCPENRKLAEYFGSERDGGFAQYTTVPEENAFVIKSNLSDAELATFPCSYSTAEHMLDRIKLREGEKILIPGASCGVGSALIQLAKRRKAKVLAITSKSKMDIIREIGAYEVFDRNQKDLSKIFVRSYLTEK